MSRHWGCGEEKGSRVATNPMNQGSTDSNMAPARCHKILGPHDNWGPWGAPHFEPPLWVPFEPLSECERGAHNFGALRI